MWIKRGGVTVTNAGVFVLAGGMPISEGKRWAVDDDTYSCWYTPETIDRILRNWPVYVSRSQHLGHANADAHRPAKGKRGDALRSADLTADVSKAMVAVLLIGGLEWRTVELRRHGHTFGQMASALHVGKQTVYDGYQIALVKMAGYLGWVAVEEP
jgi:hypothetical protein